jgi:ubiquinone/menaquinone biosynthesis C-methylase UbiE
MYEYETSYWWYRGLHSILVDTLRALELPPDARILDMGCGTGQNAVNLERQLSRRVYAFDFSQDAARFWSRRGLDRASIASINETPYADNTFDVAMTIDVLESDAVDEARAIGELWRVVKPGGYLVLTVPAYKWLLTEEHHRAVHASRRYSRTDVVTLLRRRQVRVLYTTHLFASVFPAVAAYRLLLQKLTRAPEQPRSELRPLPPGVNTVLSGVMDAERRLLKSTTLPFGSSILAVAQKVSHDD